MTTRIFIGSVQKELAAERRALKEYVQSALNAEFVEMTQPFLLQSPTLKYRLTDKGRAWLAKADL